MLDSTQAVRPVEQQRTATVTSLWADVVLDDAAIEAQRLALLAELTAERFDLAYVRGGERATRPSWRRLGIWSVAPASPARLPSGSVGVVPPRTAARLAAG